MAGVVITGVAAGGDTYGLATGALGDDIATGLVTAGVAAGGGGGGAKGGGGGWLPDALSS